MNSTDIHLLYTLTCYPPSVGGAQLHQHLIAQSIQNLGHSLQIVSHWDANRTDWLLGTTLKSRNLTKNYEINGIPVHLMGFSLIDKLRMLPWIPLYYPRVYIPKAVMDTIGFPSVHRFPHYNGGSSYCLCATRSGFSAYLLGDAQVIPYGLIKVRVEDFAYFTLASPIKTFHQLFLSKKSLYYWPIQFFTTSKNMESRAQAYFS